MNSYDEYRKVYVQERQPFIAWKYRNWGNQGYGVCRIGKFRLNPDRDWVSYVDPYADGRNFIHRKAEENETSSVPVSAVKQGLRHLPKSAEIEMYFGDMSEEEREKFRKAFPDAKEIETND